MFKQKIELELKQMKFSDKPPQGNHFFTVMGRLKPNIIEGCRGQNSLPDYVFNNGLVFGKKQDNAFFGLDENQKKVIEFLATKQNDPDVLKYYLRDGETLSIYQNAFDDADVWHKKQQATQNLQGVKGQEILRNQNDLIIVKFLEFAQKSPTDSLRNQQKQLMVNFNQSCNNVDVSKFDPNYIYKNAETMRAIIQNCVNSFEPAFRDAYLKLCEANEQIPFYGKLAWETN